MNVHLPITFESGLVSPQNSVLEITVLVYEPVAEINAILEVISRKFLMVRMEVIVIENSPHCTVVLS